MMKRPVYVPRQVVESPVEIIEKKAAPTDKGMYLRDMDAEYEMYRKDRRNKEISFLTSKLVDRLKSMHHNEVDNIFADKLGHEHHLHDVAVHHLEEMCSHKREAYQKAVNKYD